MTTADPAAVRERILASPLAKRLARQAGLDLASLQGTGPHGRIVKRDIEAALAAGRGASAPTAALRARRSQPCRVPPPSGVRALSDETILALYDKGTYEIIPHDKMRKRDRRAPDARPSRRSPTTTCRSIAGSTSCCARASA